MQKKEQGKARFSQIELIVLVNAFVYMCPAIYTTFFSAYLSQEGLSVSQIGVLFSLAPAMYIVATPLWARLADFTGRRVRVLMGICLGTAGSLMLFFVSKGFTACFFAALLLDAFVTSVVPLSDSVLLEESKRLKVSFSVVRLGGTVGYAAVVVTCGFFFSANPALMFPVAACAFVLFAGVLALLPKNQKPAEKMSKQPVRLAGAGGIRAYLTTEFWFVLLFGFLGYIGLSFIAAYVGSYMIALGYGHMEIAIAGTISALSEIPTLLFIRRGIGKHSLVNVLFLSCMLFGLRAFLVSTGRLSLMYCASLLQSVTYMPLYFCCVTYVSGHLPPEAQSQGQSLLVLFQSGMGGIVGYLLGGQAVQWLGMKNGYRLFAAIILVGALVLMGVYQMKCKRKEQCSHD